MSSEPPKLSGEDIKALVDFFEILVEIEQKNPLLKTDN